MIGLRQKGLNIDPYLWIQSFFNSSACNNCSVLEVSARLLAITWRKTFILLIKERFRLAENLRSTRSARCSPSVFF